MDRQQRRVLRLRNHVMAKSEAPKEPVGKDKGTSNAIAYNDVTKSDIAKMLRKKGISYNKRDTKEELYDLLLGSD